MHHAGLSAAGRQPNTYSGRRPDPVSAVPDGRQGFAGRSNLAGTVKYTDVLAGKATMQTNLSPTVTPPVVADVVKTPGSRLSAPPTTVTLSSGLTNFALKTTWRISQRYGGEAALVNLVLEVGTEAMPARWPAPIKNCDGQHERVI